jgi:hypothetical protein
MGNRAVPMTPRLETASRDPPRIDEVCPKRRVFMQSPMDIAQFNALLHSRKDQTQLMSALFKLTTISDLDTFNLVLQPQGLWSGWH